MATATAATFIYKGIDRKGNKVKGEAQGRNRLSAAETPGQSIITPAASQVEEPLRVLDFEYDSVVIG